MTVYEVPPNSPYQARFRVIGWGVVTVLLGILLFSIFVPDGFSDSITHGIGWLAGAIVLAAALGATALAVKEGSWKLMRKLHFEISNGKIIKTREDLPSATVEIPLNEIESLRERGGWLFVGGGGPGRQIGIPKEVSGFDDLKRELVAISTLTPAKVKVHPFSWFPLLLMILAYVFLFTSHVRVEVVAAGVLALISQGFGTYSLWRILQEKTISKMVMPTFVFIWLVVAWLVYQRVSATG